MATHGTGPAEQYDPQAYNMYPYHNDPYETNPFMLWSYPTGHYDTSSSELWAAGYPYLDNMPELLGSTDLPAMAHPSAGKALSASRTGNLPLNRRKENKTHPSSTTSSHRRRPSTPEQVSRHDVPTIVTHQPSRSNTVTPGYNGSAKQVNQTGHLTKPREKTRNAYMTPPELTYPVFGGDVLITPPSNQSSQSNLSPTTRRTSVSSSGSGPVFSYDGTPVSTAPNVPSVPETQFAVPYPPRPLCSPSVGSHNQSAHWSPYPPQSPSMRMQQQQWSNGPQRHRGAVSGNMTAPTRRKPRPEHAFPEVSTASVEPHAEPAFKMKKRRAATAAVPQPLSVSCGPSPQIAQSPVSGAEHLFTSPDAAPQGFPASLMSAYAATNVSQLAPAFEYGGLHPASLLAPSAADPAHAITAHPMPPNSDFTDFPAARRPIYQPPLSESDIYTPRYKRRNLKGEWEGWCGICEPGQWHNLKNSRYWDDKLRNHGICARTKQKFDEPIHRRVIDLQGRLVEVAADPDHPEDWVVSGTDGSLRQREGLCGHCHKWVAMDGARSKDKNKIVGWWNHAYKCHAQRDKVTATGATRHVPSGASMYLPHTTWV